MHALSSRRVRRTLIRLVSSLLVVLGFAWVALYFASLLQRKHAERLIADLRAFPFATAGFVEARELAVRNGGKASQQVPPQAPPFTCTVQDCTFEVWIKHPLLNLPLRGRSFELAYSMLPYLGIRPWAIYSILEVRGGILTKSTTSVGQLRRGVYREFHGIVPIEYFVFIDRSNSWSWQDIDRSVGYRIGQPSAITGPPAEMWDAWVPPVPNAPTQRVFDIDVHCLTLIFRGCVGLEELAPSAWADHEAILAKLRKEQQQ